MAVAGAEASMNAAFEPVTIQDRATVDDDGYPVGGGDPVTVNWRGQPLGLDEDVGRDREGTYTELRVFAPAGTCVSASSEAMIRGEWFRVSEPPHDWSAYRRPVMRRHRPSVVFVAKRGEG